MIASEVDVARSVGELALEREERKRKLRDLHDEYLHARTELQDRYTKAAQAESTNLIGCEQKLKAYGISLDADC